MQITLYLFGSPGLGSLSHQFHVSTLDRLRQNRRQRGRDWKGETVGIMTFFDWWGFLGTGIQSFGAFCNFWIFHDLICVYVFQKVDCLVNWIFGDLCLTFLRFFVSARSIFAWVAFNRDGFADNVSWRQAQKYQQKNYNISRPLLQKVNISGRTNFNIRSTPARKDRDRLYKRQIN